MTVSSDLSRGSYVADTGPFEFVVPFYFLETSHVLVVRRAASGTETVLEEGTHYDVDGAGDSSGGTVTIKSGHEPDATDRIIIIRNVPLTQETDYVENDAFTAETHERALDKLTMINQQQTEELGRALKLQVGYEGDPVTITDPVANLFLRYSSDGSLIEPVELTTSVTEFAPVLSGSVSDNSLLIYSGGVWTDAAPGDVVDSIGAEPASETLLKADITNELTVGYSVETYDLGDASGVSGGTLVIDHRNGALQKLELDDDLTISPDASRDGRTSILVTNDAVGGHSLTLPAGWNLVTGSHSTDANAVSLFECLTIAGASVAVLRITGVA